MMLLDEEEIGIFERDAGYLNPELCVKTHLDLAEKLGAELHFNERMTDYQIVVSDGQEAVAVTTDKGQYVAKKLVLTVGAWAPQLVGPDFPIPLHIERRVLCWFRPTELRDEFKVPQITLFYPDLFDELRRICCTEYSSLYLGSRVG